MSETSESQSGSSQTEELDEVLRDLIGDDNDIGFKEEIKKQILQNQILEKNSK